MKATPIIAGAALAALALIQTACTPPQVVDILNAAVGASEAVLGAVESNSTISPADQAIIANYESAVNACLSAVSTAVKTVPPLTAQQEAVAVAPACVAGLRQIPQLSSGTPNTVINALNAALPAIVAVLDFLPQSAMPRLAAATHPPAVKPGIHVKASIMAPVDAGIVRINAKLAHFGKRGL